MGLNTGSIAIWMVFAVLGTCLNLGGGVFAQNQSCLANNAAIDYLFGYQSPHDTIDAEGKWDVVGYTKLIVMVRLDAGEKKCLSRLNREQILRLLRNPLNDYAMNLILYDYFDLDAGYLGQLNLKDWKKQQKALDIHYGKQTLRRHPLNY
ncbi:MAG: hypothetical protein IPN95_30015 [Bacteroidetes bacterium]|nr:hypothetical protein [Bacteroidota bacterium]MBL0016163.1 hypothetical protein [Bacteroidota bacterium]MBP6639673.1 hypothetical protein [Bacteroidia bacterium]MBP6720879.1 hypothetical protein [Bacteroidia bacterium]MBP8073258.1 hypothetical protein [Bacteroidia bacterium]